MNQNFWNELFRDLTHEEKLSVYVEYGRQTEKLTREEDEQLFELFVNADLSTHNIRR